MTVVDFTYAESVDEVRRYLTELGLPGVNPWLVRTVQLEDGYAMVTSAVPDERGNPSRRTHITRHQRTVTA